MTVRKLIILSVLMLLVAPRAVEATKGCACERAKPAPASRGCCDPPESKKTKPPVKDCCEVAPVDRSNGEMVETVRPAVPAATALAFPPAAVLTAGLSVFRFAPAAHSGDPPGNPPDLQVSLCTFRI